MAVPTSEKTSAVSTHVSDALLQPFLQKDFDPATYFNSTLPTLSIGASAKPQQPTNSAGLADVSSQAQTLLSQLNAQASRLTTVLTQLTDDIIRSGGRLAYEVDVLRGEAIGLSEIVNDGLQKEISLFVKEPLNGEKNEGDNEDSPVETKEANSSVEAAPAEPSYITQLRMLTRVRQRLDSVIKIFGEAMHWTLPPSEISLTSSFISVSAPEPGSDSQSREQKGKEFAERLRTEIADLVLSAENPQAGFNAAQTRIDALKDLAQLWKGTAEEKARIRFVEGLVKLAEDRLKDAEKGEGSRFGAAKTASPRKNTISGQTHRAERGNGFLDNLHRLRNAE